MFNEILYFILQIILPLIGMAFLLRAWFYAVRMPPFNPYSKAIFQVTDWAVQPIRKLITPHKYLDLPSLLATWLCAVIFLFGSWLLLSGTALPVEYILKLLLAAVFTTIKWALSTTLWLILIQVILSWINPTAPAMPLLLALTNPIMEPVRRRLPATGAIDFSPLLVLLVLQVLNMVVQGFSFALLPI